MRTAAENKKDRIISNVRKINKAYEDLIEIIASEFPRNLHARNKTLGLLHEMQNCCIVPKPAAHKFNELEEAAVWAFVFLCGHLIQTMQREIHALATASWTEKIADIINPLKGKKTKIPKFKPGTLSARARATIKSMEPTFDGIFESIPEKAEPLVQGQATKLVQLGKQLEAVIGKEYPEAADALIAFIILLFGTIAAMRRTVK